jgi:hypothetical protein
MAAVQVCVDMGAWLYAWNTNTTDYDGINDELGVKFVDTGLDDNKKPILTGVNNQKPQKVRITYGTLKDGLVGGGETAKVKEGTITRMCQPTLKEQTVKASLAGKKVKVARRGAGVKEYDILGVSFVGR